MRAHVCGSYMSVTVWVNPSCYAQLKNFTRQDHPSEPVLTSHWDGELWAVAVAPDGKTFATGMSGLLTNVITTCSLAVDTLSI